MDKIYSRPRIKIPKIIIRKKIPNTKRKKMTTLLVIFMIAFFTAIFILNAILPMFDTLCENRAEAIATIVSNEQASIVMKKHTYDELFTIEKDDNGNIIMIKSNVMPINEIISDVANKIQEGIDKRGGENVEIALRKFYRNKIICRKWT